MGDLVAVILWPADPERGMEVYGPFESEEAQVKWSDDCIKAAEQGNELLKGTFYLLTRVAEPFNPADYKDEDTDE
jgi:hypothetical protein